MWTAAGRPEQLPFAASCRQRQGSGRERRARIRSARRRLAGRSLALFGGGVAASGSLTREVLPVTIRDASPIWAHYSLHIVRSSFTSPRQNFAFVNHHSSCLLVDVDESLAL